jgi:geranylgeranyl reductase family protein
MLHDSPEKVYDAGIVGAGPSGSACAYYLARAGRNVLLLDRARFPRDKICGDAVVPRAQVHLKRMGILPRLVDEGRARPARMGGFISPGGWPALGRSEELIGDTVLSIKRYVLDEQMVRAATAGGANLCEGCSVETAEFDSRRKLWRIHARDGRQFKARAVIAADGANSRLARSLGVVNSRPTAVCSRAYVARGSHDCELDGVCFYRRDLLPGYAALFHEADGDLNYCCYILPGGRRSVRDLRQMHNALLMEDPHLKRMLGPRAELEPMRSAPLRLGGIARSCGDHLLVIGDAAGHIDPLTGEGIQYAMDSGQLAAETLNEALSADDLSRIRLEAYQAQWHRSFGDDFAWSLRCASLMARWPQLLDIAAVAIQSQGQKLMQAWAGIMTGSQPKSQLLRPGIVWPMAVAVVRHWWRPPLRRAIDDETAG